MKRPTKAQMKQEVKEKLARMKAAFMKDPDMHEARYKLIGAENWHDRALERERWWHIHSACSYFNDREREFWQILEGGAV